MDTKVKSSSKALFEAGSRRNKLQRIILRKLVLIIPILFLVLSGQKVFAQGVGISETNIVPHASAILELKHTGAGPFKGFLIPRMTTMERLSIDVTTPPVPSGLIVYDTDSLALYYWDGFWVSLAASQTGFAPLTGVYTDANGNLTSAPPSSGTIGYWDRIGTILSPSNAGDDITTSGDISTSGTGTMTSAGLLTASDGLNVTNTLQANDNVILGAANTDDATINASILNQADASGNALTFEGATTDDILTSFIITDPTISSKEITFPDRSGTVVLAGSGTTFQNNLAVSTDANGQLINAIDGQVFNVNSNAINLGDDGTDQTTIIGNTDATGGLDITGGTGLNVGAGNFTADNTGNADAAGTLNADGATTLGSTLNVTGATTLNDALTVADGVTATNINNNTINIGNAADDAITLQGNNTISGNALTVTTTQTDLNSATTNVTGAAINIGDNAADAVDITGVTNINTGNLTVDAPVTTINSGVTNLGTDNTDDVSLNAEIQKANPFILEGATDDDFETTITLVDPDQDNLITLPNKSGTVVLSGGGNLGPDLAVHTDANGDLVVADDTQNFNVNSNAINLGDDGTDQTTIIGNTDATGGLDITGGTGLNVGAGNFTADNTGNADAAGTLNADGATTLGSTLNVTGATTLNDALTVADGVTTTNINNNTINIGNAADDAITLQGNNTISGNALTVTTTQTDLNSATTNVTGTAINIGDAETDAVDINGTIQEGSLIAGTNALVLDGSSPDAVNRTTIAVTDPTDVRTITLPDKSGTVVLSGGGNLGPDLAVHTDANGDLVVADDTQNFNVNSNAINLGDDGTDQTTIIGNTDATGGLDITGGTGLNVGAGNFTADNTGNADAAGTLNADGATTLGSTLNVTGATTLNDALTVADGVTATNINNNTINIGNAADDAITLQGNNTISGNALTVTTTQTDLNSATTNVTGAAINIGDNAADAVDITGVTNINTGNLTVDAPVTTINSGVTNLGTDNTDDVSLNAEIQKANPFILEGATDDDFETTITLVDPDQDNLITLPNKSGTVVLSGGGNLGPDLAVHTDANGDLVVADDTQNFNVNSNAINLGDDGTDQTTIIGNTDATGGLDITGGTGLNVGAGNFTADNTGNADAAGTLNADGATTLGSTLNVTGATTLNDALTVADGVTATNINNNTINIGNAADDAITLQGNNTISGNALTVTTTQTDLNSATTNVTGTAINIGDAETDAVDINGTIQEGSLIAGTNALVLDGSSPDAVNRTTIAVTDPTDVRTITLPDKSGTVVLSGGGNLGPDLAVHTDANGDLVVADDTQNFNVNSNAINLGDDGTDQTTIIGNTDATGGLDITGGTGLNVGAGNFTADNTGNADAAGTLNADGATTLGSTLNVTGATTLNDALTVADGVTATNINNNTINIGNAADDAITLQGNNTISGNALTVTTTQTDLNSATTNVTGTAINIGDAETDAVDINGTIQEGSLIAGTNALVLDGSSPDAVNRTTIAVTDPTDVRTITLPDKSGTVVLSGGGNLGPDLAVHTDANGDLVVADDTQNFNVNSNAINLGDDGTDQTTIIGNTDATGGLDITGGTGLNVGAGNFTADNTGNADAAGTLNADGATTLGSTLNVTGATTLNDALTVADGVTATNINNNTINIGNAADDAITLQGNNTISGNALTVTTTQTDLNSATTNVTGAAINIGDNAADAVDITGVTNINTGNLTVDAPVTTINSGVTNLGTDNTDDVSLNAEIQKANPFILEGATDDDFETTITLVDPDQDNLITLPNKSGTVVLSGGGNLGPDLAVHTDANGDLVVADDTQNFNVNSNAINLGDDGTDQTTIIGNTDATGGLDITGGTGLNVGAGNFTADNTGNADAAGTLNADGATTLGSTLNVTGATTLNDALTVADGVTATNINNNTINIGNAADDAITLQGNNTISGNALTVTTTQTDLNSATTNVTGTAINIGDAETDAVDINGTIQEGSLIAGTNALVLDGSSPDAVNRTTIAVTDPTDVRTITLPDKSGTVVLSGGGNLGPDLAVHTDANGDLVVADDTQNFNVNSNAINLGDDGTDQTTIIGNTDATGGLDITGGTGLNVGAGNFTADNTGNADAAGTLNADGATTLGSTLNVTGATTLNDALTVADGVTATNINNNTINIGNAADDAITLQGNNTISGNALTVTTTQTDLNSATTNVTGAAINIGDNAADAVDITGVTNINTGNLTVDAPVTTINSGVTNLGTDNTDDVSLNAEIQKANPFILEGATDDDFETTITLVDPDQDNLITLPNKSGTVVLSGGGNLGPDLAVHTDANGDLVVADDTQNFNVNSNAINLGDDGTDQTTIIGNTDATGGLDITGGTGLNVGAGNFTADNTGNADAAGTLNADGATTLGSTLNVTGATTLASTLDVTGATNVGDLTATGTVDLGANAIQATEISDGAVTSAKINDGEIVNADVSATANIAATKLSDGSIDDTEFQNLDGLNQTLATTDNVTFNQITGTLQTASQTNITAVGSLTSLDVTGATTLNGNVNLGDAGTDVVTITGGISFDEATEDLNLNVADQTVAGGELIIPNLAGASETIATLSDIAGSDDLADLNDVVIADYGVGKILVADGTDSYDEQTLGGDATIAANGNLTIEDNAITSAKINDGEIVNADVSATANIAATKLSDGSIDDTEFQNLDGLNQTLATTDNVTFNQITGTLQTASQTNITAVGSLTSLDVTGATTLNGNVNLGDAGTDVVTITGGISFDEATEDLNLNVADQTVAGGELIIPNLAGASETIATLSDIAGSDDLADLNDVVIADYGVGKILVADGTDSYDEQTLGGDATIAANGNLTIEDNAITSAKINDGEIVNADVSATANIAATKLSDGSIDDTEFQNLDGLNQTLATTDNVTFNQITGTLQTASQTNITAVGSLTSLDVTGATTLNGNVNLGDAGTDVVTITGGISFDEATEDLNLNVADQTVAGGELIIPNLAGASETIATLSDIAGSDDLADLNDVVIADYGVGKILVADGTDSYDEQTLGGDATIAANGNLTIEDNAITSAKINDGEIVNADVSATANIAATKLSDGSIDDTEFQNLDGLNQTLATTDNVTFNQITGTLQTASQTNITAVGSLTSLDVTGATTLNGNVNLGDAGTDVVTITGGITFDEATEDLNLNVADQTVAGGELIIPNLAGASETIATLSDIAGSDDLADLNDVVIADYGVGKILVADGTDSYDEQTLGGDATIAANGNLTIEDNAITSAKINDGEIVNADVSATANIAATKLSDGSIDDTEFQNLDGLNQTLATTDNVTFNQITGTLQTASQTNITAVGSLTSLDVTGATTLNGNVNLGDAGTDVVTITGGITFDEATEDLNLNVADQTVAGGELIIPNLAGASETIATLSDIAGSDDLADLNDVVIADYGVGKILVADGTDSYDEQTLGGDATIAANGNLTIEDNAITSAKINDGEIVNADVSATANIAATKLSDGSIDDTEFQNLDGLNQTLATTDNVTFNQITGTLQTAAQTNITSVGTLTSATVSGATTLNGTVTLGDDAADAISVGGTATFAEDIILDDGANDITMQLAAQTGAANLIIPDLGGADKTLATNADITTLSGNAVLRDGSQALTANWNAGAFDITASTFIGDLTGNASTATTASNLAGGVAGSIPYQTGAGATSLTAAGTAGQVLTSNGAGAPTWTNATDDQTAAEVTYDNTTSGLAAANVKAALDELESEKLALAGGTMSGTINMNNNNITNGGTITGSTFTDGTLSINAGAITSASSINTGSLTATGTVNINNDAAANTTNIGTGNTTGTVTIGGTGTQTIDLGNGAGAKNVNLGSNNTTSTTALLSGSGGLNLNVDNNQLTNINTGTSTGQVNIGSSANTVLVDASSTTISGALNYGVDAVGSNAYSVTLSPSPTAYSTGMLVIAQLGADSGTNPTLSVSGLAAQPVVDKDGAALTNNVLKSGSTYMFVYDGTNFRVLNK